MRYIYHLVPPAMKGTMLYPLNELKELFPEIYAAEVAKYRGREQKLNSRIPMLGNCLWNDVLFLTAVQPVEFRKAYTSVVRTLRKFRYFQIPIDFLDPTRMIVVKQLPVGQTREYEKFDRCRLEHYATIPSETFRHWQEAFVQGNRPFLYLYIPHILYRGTIDVSNVSIVEA